MIIVSLVYYSTHQTIRYTPLQTMLSYGYVSKENLNNFLTARARCFSFFSQKEEKEIYNSYARELLVRCLHFSFLYLKKNWLEHFFITFFYFIWI